jgi:hypothetical protein
MLWTAFSSPFLGADVGLYMVVPTEFDFRAF